MAAQADVLLRTEIGSPCAIRICSRTRSSPVTSSVTVCSTWIRVFISMKKYVAVAVEQPLDRPGRPVAGRARRVDRDLPDPLAQPVVDRGRRRLLDELLMAALDRAVALAEEDHVPVRVGENLHLDMPRVFEVPLDVDGVVGEVRRPSRRAASSAAPPRPALRTTFIPLPPPPAAALISSG